MLPASEKAGFQTEDLVRLMQPRGKYAGHHIGRFAGLRADRRFEISAPAGKITAMLEVTGSYREAMDMLYA